MTDSEDHSTHRAVVQITKGYHVLAGDRWWLVDDAVAQGESVVLFFGDVATSFKRNERLWSRSPAEQVYAVSAALPTRKRIRIARGTRLGNPFNGSCPSPIPAKYT